MKNPKKSSKNPQKFTKLDGIRTRDPQYSTDTTRSIIISIFSKKKKLKCVSDSLFDIVQRQI